MPDRPYHVLFLCTGNSARSLLAECSLRRAGGEHFVSHSAGSRPTGRPHAMAIELLQELGHDTSGLRSKSWEEFSQPGSPALDFVFTVCDRARNEPCPVWPGQPMTAHWGVEDPAAFEGPEDRQREVFLRAYRELDRRIQIFTSLPFDELDRLSLQQRLDGIGKTSGPAD